MRQYFGSLPETTVKSVVVLMDGQPAAFVGIAREYPAARYFAEISDELVPYLNSVIVWRAIKASMKFVTEYPTEVYSVGQHDEGCRMLRRLGFKLIEDRTFIWVGYKQLQESRQRRLSTSIL